MVLSQLKGGRGVLEVHQLFTSQVSQLREYYDNKRHVSLYNNIYREDDVYTPLHLSDPKCPNIRHPTLEQIAMEWRKKSFYGQHPLVQDQPNLDKESSNLWPRRGKLFPETKGFVLAIQDKVIGTKNYQKHIFGHNVDMY